MKKEKNSLEKSHSAWSNTKLTALSLLAVVSISVFWGTLALATTSPTPITVILLVASIALTLFTIKLFGKFKR